MANQLSHVPHILNIESGYNKYDPVHKSIFEVKFTLPTFLDQFNAEYTTSTIPTVDLLGQQVVSVSGLEALQKTPAIGEQKFHGATVSYINPVLDSTAADITVVFNLNLRNVTDNFVLRVFKDWARICYDIQTGARLLKSQYCCSSLVIAEANRDGAIWRAYAFKDVMLASIQGLADLDYSATDAQQLTVQFRSDYWTEIMGSGWQDPRDGSYPVNYNGSGSTGNGVEYYKKGSMAGSDVDARDNMDLPTLQGKFVNGQ